MDATKLSVGNKTKLNGSKLWYCEPGVTAATIPALLCFISPQVADSLLLVHKLGEGLDQFHRGLLDCLMAQGLPTTCHLLQVCKYVRVCRA